MLIIEVGLLLKARRVDRPLRHAPRSGFHGVSKIGRPLIRLELLLFLLVDSVFKEGLTLMQGRDIARRRFFVLLTLLQVVVHLSIVSLLLMLIRSLVAVQRLLPAAVDGEDDARRLASPLFRGRHVQLLLIAA